MRFRALPAFGPRHLVAKLYHRKMREREPISRPPVDEYLADYEQSRFLQFGNEIQLPGDPETGDDFARAQHYLEAITAHCIEFGPWWEKQPQDMADELAYHNAWHRYEVEQERKAGEQKAEYREVNLHHLCALSKRRVLAFEETGWAVTQAYRVVNLFDRLIEQAVLEQEALEQMLVSTTQNGEAASIFQAVRTLPTASPTMPEGGENSEI